ncbi:hypothetical protein BIW11_08701 [Tropilaelaps mercedesae]|uniref:Uncharacterized protein n=1 Tax=Tropilaelaps mercedesae TaxID=418985 RepID=A0A1V9XNC5_9ACAR|nr:hypothetical protein BIW11_08701 [Tropilaelaps mercedesae]
MKMSASWPMAGHVYLVIFIACSLLKTEARHYVLIRRVYAGEEGKAMLERDESSRLLGWPLGVSSEIALLDSAPIFQAVIDRDSGDSSNNEVTSASGAKVYRAPALQEGRSAPRRVEDASSETQKSEASKARKDTQNRTGGDQGGFQSDDQTGKQPKRIDIHNHENYSVTEKSTEGSDSDEEELEPINIEDIEKIMARHKIRIMGATHPMAKIEIDQERAESITGEQRPIALPHNDTEHQSNSSGGRKKSAVPEQVMRIAEWLLNQAP